VSTRDNYIYDAFISYSHKDGNWVWGWFLPRLKDAGIRVCIDTDTESFEPGDLSISAMERAVSTSRHTIAVLSPSYLASEWSQFESILTQTADPTARERRLIPLLLEPCEIPPRLRSLIYSDFTRIGGREEALKGLLPTFRKISKHKQAKVEEQPVEGRLKVRPHGDGEILKWKSFRDGRFEASDSFFEFTTKLTDAVSSMWEACKDLDPKTTRRVLEPNGYTNPGFTIEFQAEKFNVLVERRLAVLRSKFPLRVFAAEEPRSYDITFAFKAASNVILNRLKTRFKERLPDVTIIEEN
jgi:hypothetical protein